MNYGRVMFVLRSGGSGANDHEQHVQSRGTSPPPTGSRDFITATAGQCAAMADKCNREAIRCEPSSRESVLSQLSRLV